MLEINATIEVDAPSNEVWQRIAKLDDVQLFVESVTKSFYSSERTEGIGAERTCEVRGFGTLQEKIVQWEDGESLTYAIEGMPKVIRSAQSHWTLHAITPFKTRVSVTSAVETRYGPVGAFMATFMMKPRMTRLLEDALASFKDFVEHSIDAPIAQPQPLQTRVA